MFGIADFRNSRPESSRRLSKHSRSSDITFQIFHVFQIYHVFLMSWNCIGPWDCVFLLKPSWKFTLDSINRRSSRTLLQACYFTVNATCLFCCLWVCTVWFQTTVWNIRRTCILTLRCPMELNHLWTSGSRQLLSARLARVETCSLSALRVPIQTLHFSLCDRSAESKLIWVCCADWPKDALIVHCW